MKIHEYQAKALMKSRGIAVPEGVVVRTVDQAVDAVRQLVESTGNPVVVVSHRSMPVGGGRDTSRSIRTSVA